MKDFTSAFSLQPSALAVWLPDMDLNHDKQIQSLLCYRYTIGQTSPAKVEFPPAESRITAKTLKLGNAKTEPFGRTTGRHERRTGDELVVRVDRARR